VLRVDTGTGGAKEVVQSLHGEIGRIVIVNEI
jgi:hypothetical protein